MRIVCLVTNDLVQDQRMDRICTTLAGAGHDLTLVGRELATSRPLPRRPYRQERIPCRFTRGKAFYAEYNYRLFVTLRRREIDVVCAVDLDTLLAGHYLRRRLGCALVYDAHEWFSETPEVVSRPPIRAAWRGLARWLVPQTQARYTVGPRLAERLGAAYGVPFATVRNLPRAGTSAAPVPVTERDSGGRRVLLYQGMLNPGRGLATAVRALALLPNHELWVVGSGPEEAGLRALAEELRVSDRVWLAGFRDPADLRGFTAAAWLGLNLLEAASPSYYYSLANKALDYVQAGLPSVQMDFPEYAALNKTYGCYLLLDELKSDGLAALVARIDEDQVLYAHLREGCRRAAEELIWEREETRLLSIYAALDGAGGPR